MIWDVIGIWLGAMLTLSLYSFLYRDNPFYKFTEHLFVGMSAGYWVIYNIFNVLKPNLWDRLVGVTDSTGSDIRAIVSSLFHDNAYYRFTEHLAGYRLINDAFDSLRPDMWVQHGGPQHSIRPDLFMLIPTAFGLFMLARLVPRMAGWSRLALAMIVGTGAGLSLVTTLRTNILTQVEGTMVPIGGTGTGEAIGNFILVVGVVCGLVYFFFSKAHRGVLGGAANIGITILMVAFGASFGYTVMARISLLIGQAQFLLFEWLPTIPLFRGLTG